ncbi:spore coat protein [Clostridium cylindrosporum]|uniref:Coat F domain-containing protein n=1 Tax=Clostridium cylindrosporum DSM 605 TaxID=1121307 RepID=A0A0J8D5J7_CLOCY|nr:spore coat protein [Clostridium cylindrosporum]KMT21102.1 hypothetical protein CLCY_1c03360 [Clostridium cylindrosporum DSM 605]
MQDKERLNDMLNSEKLTISAYSTGITESSCTNLRDTLVQNFESAQRVQYEIFNAMSKRGWYEVKDAQASDVQQVKDNANQLLNSLK